MASASRAVTVVGRGEYERRVGPGEYSKTNPRWSAVNDTNSTGEAVGVSGKDSMT